MQFDWHPGMYLFALHVTHGRVSFRPPPVPRTSRIGRPALKYQTGSASLTVSNRCRTGKTRSCRRISPQRAIRFIAIEMHGLPASSMLRNALMAKHLRAAQHGRFRSLLDPGDPPATAVRHIAGAEIRCVKLLKRFGSGRPHTCDRGSHLAIKHLAVNPCKCDYAAFAGRYTRWRLLESARVLASDLGPSLKTIRRSRLVHTERPVVDAASTFPFRVTLMNPASIARLMTAIFYRDINSLSESINSSSPYTAPHPDAPGTIFEPVARRRASNCATGLERTRPSACPAHKCL
ncbi:hypothetical protein B0G77_5349 [Paraburkholderia sp. BL10I2N1]|nr:hypothetical protein B0G77_5349 [Paraburkholderia sp. BL10I2N1]